jgi:hypothetical protein
VIQSCVASLWPLWAIAGAAEGLARSGGLRRLGSARGLAGRRQAGAEGHSGPVNALNADCAPSLLVDGPWLGWP